MKKLCAALSLSALFVLHATSARADEQGAPQEPSAASAAVDPSAAPASAPDATPAPAAEASEAKAPKKEAFHEQGRFGVIGAMTDEGIQFGAVRLGEHYEVAVTANGSYSSLRSGIGSSRSDVGTFVRGGARVGLGAYNYLSLGVQGHLTVAGKDDGVSTAGSVHIGPVIGVSRYFAGTPLMITLWVQPYEYNYDLVNDGSGKQTVRVTHGFFQGGGFGLAYML